MKEQAQLTPGVFHTCTLSCPLIMRCHFHVMMQQEDPGRRQSSIMDFQTLELWAKETCVLYKLPSVRYSIIMTENRLRYRPFSFSSLKVTHVTVFAGASGLEVKPSVPCPSITNTGFGLRCTRTCQYLLSPYEVMSSIGVEVRRQPQPTVAWVKVGKQPGFRAEQKSISIQARLFTSYCILCSDLLLLPHCDIWMILPLLVHPVVNNRKSLSLFNL